MPNRRHKDVISLLVKGYKVDFNEDNPNIITCIIEGPKDTIYEEGKWRVRIEMTEKYPFKSPSVGFLDKIFHPNIEECSGAVCLNTLNENWSAIYDLEYIINIAIPQLLTYPNSDDPFNTYASKLYSSNIEEFNKKVKEYINNFSYIEDVISDNDNKYLEDDDSEGSILTPLSPLSPINP